MEDGLIISIRNWDKYNPKRDQKTYTWLRLNNDTFSGQDFCEYNASELIVWISILCEASKKNRSDLDLKLPYLKTITRLNEKSINDAILKLHEDNFLEIKADVVSRPRTTPARQITTPTYERTNVRTNNIVENDFDYTHPLDIVQDAYKPDLDLLYAEYPKKEGKKKAYEKLTRIIKTEKDFDKIRKAISNYKVQCIDRDKNYIKQFSSFVSVWEDYLEIEDDEYSADTLRILKEDEERPYTNLTEIYREIVENENN